MRALILGAGGQVGRALAASAPSGAAVVALDRGQCDLTDPEQLASSIEAARPEIVFNAAAFTAVDRAELEPEAAWLVNAVAPGHVAAASRRTGARTIHVSTDFVFDGATARPYRPSDNTVPLQVYGRTKLEGEKAVLAADPGALIIRTAWVYASQGKNFVRTMLRMMGERDRVSVVADQIGTPTHAASLARALWTLVAKEAAGIHHYTDAGVASWYDFAVAIEEEARALGLLATAVQVSPISTEDYPTPAQRPAYSVLDKSSAWSLIGQTPAHWRVALRTALGELKTNG